MGFFPLAFQRRKEMILNPMSSNQHVYGLGGGVMKGISLAWEGAQNRLRAGT